MSKDVIEIKDEKAINKLTRDKSRWVRLNHATGSLKQYFEDEGSSPAQAKSKINQLSTEVSEMGGEPIMNYIMGNKQPLKSKINASVLPFMTGAAKTVILNQL